MRKLGGEDIMVNPPALLGELREAVDAANRRGDKTRGDGKSGSHAGEDRAGSP